MQTAYIQLLQNPFYVPDDHTPTADVLGKRGAITSRRFIREIERIGESWKVGMSNV